MRRTKNGTETHRDREYTEQKCAECGGFKQERRGRGFHATGNRNRYLWRYWIQTEGELPLSFVDPHLFCDEWCRNNFYRRQK